MKTNKRAILDMMAGMWSWPPLGMIRVYSFIRGWEASCEITRGFAFSEEPTIPQTA
jgi:hypothetical protein